MKTIGVIPPRYGSTRLEGKPLKDICGKPMIQLVYEAAQQTRVCWIKCTWQPTTSAL